MATAVGAGCGGSPRSTAPSSSRPTPPVTAVAADHWVPPTVPGPPSTAKFCTLLVADYMHIQTNAIATTMKVRQQIVGDYVRFTPTVVGAAPPPIAAPATLYLSSIAKLLGILNKVGLDASKAPPGQVGAILLDPQVRAAGTQVFAYSKQYCHYDITGAT